MIIKSKTFSGRYCHWRININGWQYSVIEKNWNIIDFYLNFIRQFFLNQWAILSFTFRNKNKLFQPINSIKQNSLCLMIFKKKNKWENEIWLKNRISETDSIKYTVFFKVSLIKKSLLRLDSTQHSSALELFLLFGKMALKMTVYFSLLSFIIFDDSFDISLLTHVVFINLSDFSLWITCWLFGAVISPFYLLINFSTLHLMLLTLLLPDC